MNFAYVALIGILFAFAELLSRYKSTPALILRVGSSYLYILVNVAASVFMYWLIDTQNWELGGFASTDAGKVLVSGFSAMALMRSSLLYFKVGDKSYDVGLASVTQIFLNVADRGFDRKSSAFHLDQIAGIMKGVDFKKAALNLPLICISIMDNLSLEEQQAFGNEVAVLSTQKDVDDFAKSIKLGKIISRYTGLRLLARSVAILREQNLLSAESIITLSADLESTKSKFKN